MKVPWDITTIQVVLSFSSWKSETDCKGLMYGSRYNHWRLDFLGNKDGAGKKKTWIINMPRSTWGIFIWHIQADLHTNTLGEMWRVSFHWWQKLRATSIPAELGPVAKPTYPRPNGCKLLRARGSLICSHKDHWCHSFTLAWKRQKVNNSWGEDAWARLSLSKKLLVASSCDVKETWEPRQRNEQPTISELIFRLLKGHFSTGLDNESERLTSGSQGLGS